MCVDSYFALVTTEETMLGLGFRFIGVVKTVTKNFPLNISLPSIDSREEDRGRSGNEGSWVAMDDVFFG